MAPPRRSESRALFSPGIPFAIAIMLLLASAPGLAGVEIVYGSGFEDASVIERVQHDSAQYSGTNVHIGPALVTGVKTTANNSLFFVQVPPAMAGPGYPRYSGIKAFSSVPIVGLAVGDCVSFDGTVIEFQGATELSPVRKLWEVVGSE